MAEHCCATMRQNAENICAAHPDRFDCADCLIDHGEDGLYGIIIHDGGSSAVVINYCPWCGAKLPDEAR